MQKVTGIGGVFIKARDPKAMAAWYEKHLGIVFGDQVYMSFKWINENDPTEPGETVLSFFGEKNDYFDPSTSPFMINFRVKDLAALVDQLRSDGVEIIGDVGIYDYGKFGWCMDPEGNKIELWEPVEAKE